MQALQSVTINQFYVKDSRKVDTYIAQQYNSQNSQKLCKHG